MAFDFWQSLGEPMFALCVAAAQQYRPSMGAATPNSRLAFSTSETIINGGV